MARDTLFDTFETYDVIGIPISVTTLDSAADAIENWSGDNKGRIVCVREVPSLMACISDEQLLHINRKADMVTADGMPLVWIGKLRGFGVERTCGPDLMDELMKRSRLSGLKHYLYGGKLGVAETLADRFRQKYPGCQIVGWESPPFRALNPVEEDEVRGRIKASGADIVWVGISSPKQELWMDRNKPHLSQTLIGVGAAFDFHSGAVKRAPRWMQKSGLEWLHRLFSEPQRLWKRYLILAPKFTLKVLTYEFSRYMK